MKRIFLVGCPRSGTTLLQSLLAAHDEIAAFTESQFFTVHLNSRGPLHKIGDRIATRIAAFLAENGFTDDFSAVPRPEPGVRLKAGTVRELKKVIALFDALAESRGKTAWVEKTPDNLLRLSLLSAAAPDAAFIHIVRSPGANLASYRKAAEKWSGRDWSWDDAADAWLTSLNATKARLDHDPIVFYDEVVAEPEATAKRLLTGLGFPIDTYDYANYSRVAESLILPSETWKAKNTGAIGQSTADESRAEADEAANRRGLPDLYDAFVKTVHARQG